MKQNQINLLDQNQRQLFLQHHEEKRDFVGAVVACKPDKLRRLSSIISEVSYDGPARKHKDEDYDDGEADDFFDTQAVADELITLKMTVAELLSENEVLRSRAKKSALLFDTMKERKDSVERENDALKAENQAMKNENKNLRQGLAVLKEVRSDNNCEEHRPSKSNSQDDAAEKPAGRPPLLKRSSIIDFLRQETNQEEHVSSSTPPQSDPVATAVNISGVHPRRRSSIISLLRESFIPKEPENLMSETNEPEVKKFRDKRRLSCPSITLPDDSIEQPMRSNASMRRRSFSDLNFLTVDFDPENDGDTTDDESEIDTCEDNPNLSVITQLRSSHSSYSNSYVERGNVVDRIIENVKPPKRESDCVSTNSGLTFIDRIRASFFDSNMSIESEVGDVTGEHATHRRTGQEGIHAKGCLRSSASAGSIVISEGSDDEESISDSVSNEIVSLWTTGRRSSILDENSVSSHP